MRLRAGLLLIAGCFALAACGESSDDAGSSAGGGEGGIAGQPVEVILDRSAKALSEVRSYRIAGTETGGGSTTRIAADVSASGASRLVLEQGSQRMEMLVFGEDEAYLRADADFWEQQSGGGGAEVAKLLAGKWVSTADLEGVGLGEALERLQPETLAYCLQQGLGTVTKKGDGEVNGTPTVVLHDDGRAPGGAPGDLHVAAEGRPLPLRVTQTGEERPGKEDPRCSGEAETSGSRSDLTFSRFDEPVELSRPKDALDLDELAPPGGGSGADEGRELS